MAVPSWLSTLLWSRARRAGRTLGAAPFEARKERVYPELLRSNRCRLVLALEAGGRWSNEAASFIRVFARPHSREAAPALRPAGVAALVARWSALLSFAAQFSFAESLLEGRVAGQALPELECAACRLHLPATRWQPSASVTPSWAAGRREKQFPA